MKRLTRYPVEIPDTGYYRRQISCMTGCPVATNAGGYVQAIHQGDLPRAYEIARAPNPIASICGRICAHPCEDRCRRGAIDQPVSIRALKRVVTERCGPESAMPGLKEQVRQISSTDFSLLPKGVGKRKKVAIIGAGPAGLGCAHDLAVLGYDVTIFEAAPVAGGMLTLAIPEYRLPRSLVRAEIQAILDLGITLKTNSRLGRDFKLTNLQREGFEAFFLAIGTGLGRTLSIPGVEQDGVINGIDFLINVSLGYHVELGRRVVVVGGGNVAMDVARTALRQEERIEGGAVLIDAARVAVRMGAREVHLVALESREELPADIEELEAAQGEGIKVHFRKGPRRILGKEGRVTALETEDVLSVFDENRRFNPKFASGTESYFPADTVILAVGQKTDTATLQEIEGLDLNPNGTAKVDTESLATSVPGLYAGGDVVFGPRIAIEAVANGKKAALSIHEYLTGHHLQKRLSSFRPLDFHRRRDDFERRPRLPVPMEPTERRTGFKEVEIGYDLKEAREEADRCLYCHVNTIFDSEKCILCGGCVDVCPEFCLSIVDLERLPQSKGIQGVIEGRFGVLDSNEVSGESGRKAVIKDEERCIRCALCVDRCPTDAITMEIFSWEGMPATPVSVCNKIEFGEGSVSPFGGP